MRQHSQPRNVAATRRNPAWRAFALALAFASPAALAAEKFPDRPIRLVTAQAGGGSDFVSRIIADGLNSNLGVPVIVDNRGGGVIAGDIVARAPADGYTILYYGTQNYKSKNKCGGGGTTNPYTPEEACGDGYKVIDGANVTGARVSLLYNASNGYNCVVAIKTTKIGTASDVGAFLEVQGEARTTDRDEYGYYAGPVKKKAPGKCVKWGGMVGSSSYTSGFEHCG